MQRLSLIGLALIALVASATMGEEKTEEPKARLKILRVPNTSGQKLNATEASVGTYWEDKEGYAWEKVAKGRWKSVHKVGLTWCDALAEQNCVRHVMDPERGEARFEITGTDIREHDTKPFTSVRSLLARVLGEDPDKATWRHKRTKEGFTVWVPYKRATQGTPLKSVSIYGEKDLTVIVRYDRQLGRGELPKLLETLRAIAPNVLGYRSSAVQNPIARKGFEWEFTVVKNKRRLRRAKKE